MHMIEFPSKLPPPLNLINVNGMGLRIQRLGGINSNDGLICMISHRKKITNIATFQFFDYAAIWYATLSLEIANGISKCKAAFFERFTEDDHILDLSSLETTQRDIGEKDRFEYREFH